mmetsp:Transcript_21215/g.23026  ORF Transcript_21215/g.23026 Transcript_21215/m.23026 type:complete len:130 (-) Transcript_21215:2169-2558(-)|eukprot:gene8408-9095_t
MSQTIPDPRAEALRYMNENKIQILFDYLGSKLARDKPSNPNEYLLQELQYILEAKSSNQSVTLFSREDIEIMFSTFDITNRGYVSPLQYEKALIAVGLDPKECGIPSLPSFDKNTFVNHIYKEVLKHSL